MQMNEQNQCQEKEIYVPSLEVDRWYKTPTGKKGKTEKEIRRVFSHITYKRCCLPDRVLSCFRLPRRRNEREGAALGAIRGMRVGSPFRMATKGCEEGESGEYPR